MNRTICIDCIGSNAKINGKRLQINPAVCRINAGRGAETQSCFGISCKASITADRNITVAAINTGLFKIDFRITSNGNRTVHCFNTESINNSIGVQSQVSVNHQSVVSIDTGISVVFFILLVINTH